MHADDDGDRRVLPALRILVVDGARMARQHHEPGLVASHDLLAMQRHVANAGVGILHKRDARGNVAARVARGDDGARQVIEVRIGPHQPHLLNRRAGAIDGGGRNGMLEALRYLLQQAVFLESQPDRPLAAVGNDLAAGAPARMSFDVGEETGLSKLAVGLPLDGGHVARGMHRLLEADQFALRLEVGEQCAKRLIDPVCGAPCLARRFKLQVSGGHCTVPGK